MRVALYFELYRLWGGKLFRKQGTGLVSSFRNQQEALTRAGVEWVEGPRLDVDVLQINVPWLKSRWLIWRAKRKNVKVVLYAHTTVEDARGVIPGIRLLAPLYRHYLRKAYQSADRVLCPSHYTRELLISKYGVAKDRAVTLTNGVNRQHFIRNEQKRQEVRKKIAAHNECVVGTVALVMPRKGLDTWIDIATANISAEKPIKFVWVGKFFSSRSKDLVAHAPKNTLFAGYVADVAAYYSAMDIFVFPSYEENQGMAILEAASAGLPIVVRDLPVYRGWLVHGANCLIAKNTEEFKKHIQQLRSDKELRQKIASGALSLAYQNDLKTVGQSLMSIYRGL